MDPPPIRRRQRFRWSDVVVFRSSSDYANRRRILPKSAYFCLIDRISKRSWQISTRLGRILKRSQQILTRSGLISKRFGEILVDFEEIKRDLKEIRPDLDEISPDLNRSDKIDRQTTSIGGESYFQWDFQSGRLKIGFPCFNSSTDPPVSGFGSRDPPPTVAGVGSDDSRYQSVGLGWWVG